jgi:hypothetical protein
MAKITDYFSSNYLRAGDLGGKEVDVVIDKVTAEEFEEDGKKRTKPVVHFRGNRFKPLVTNKTNGMTLAIACGSEDCDTWPGKQVRLYAELVGFKGKVTEAVRVKRTPVPIEQDLNDKIDF